MKHAIAIFFGKKETLEKIVKLPHRFGKHGINLIVGCDNQQVPCIEMEFDESESPPTALAGEIIAFCEGASLAFAFEGML